MCVCVLYICSGSFAVNVHPSISVDGFTWYEKISNIPGIGTLAKEIAVHWARSQEHNFAEQLHGGVRKSHIHTHTHTHTHLSFVPDLVSFLSYCRVFGFASDIRKFGRTKD